MKLIGFLCLLRGVCLGTVAGALGQIVRDLTKRRFDEDYLIFLAIGAGGWEFTRCLYRVMVRPRVHRPAPGQGRPGAGEDDNAAEALADMQEDQ